MVWEGSMSISLCCQKPSLGSTEKEEEVTIEAEYPIQVHKPVTRRSHIF